LTFAKQALPATSKNIILVPAAWSGTSFCDTSVAPAHWNAFETNEPNHGNTLLFDRALARANHALDFSGGILRGILWHQGNYSPEKNMVDQVHRNIANLVPNSAVSIHDDLTPANGFPCGATSCIHFGTQALREMGRRYYWALRQAAEN